MESAIIKLTINNEQLTINGIDEKLFFRIVKAGFGEKRKMFKNSLAGGLQLESKIVAGILNKLKINPIVRAQELGISDWQKVYFELRKSKSCY